MSGLAAVGDGVRAALERTAAADLIVRELLRPNKKNFSSIAVLASGGYGRCDLTFHSDLDLIILYDGDVERFEGMIRHLVQGLWDRGINPGQTLLAMSDVNAGFLAIPDRATALLEARFLWGDRQLVSTMETEINRIFSGSVWSRFVQLKMEEFEARREKYGDLPRVVEPHLKAQAGGLRDFQHVFWLERARAALNGDWKLRRKRGSSARSFVGRLRQFGLLTREEGTQLFLAYDTLLRVREALRVVRKREEDLLHVPDQVAVGRALGVQGGDDVVLRETMRHAYWAFEKISRFANEFGILFAEYGVRKAPKTYHVSDYKGVYLSGGRIHLRRSALASSAGSPAELIRLLHFAVENGYPPSGRARHELRRALQRGGCARSSYEEWSEPLRSIFARKEHVAEYLRRLDELDAVGFWFPEWREVGGLTTGSYYHRYTVDEHTLRALQKLDELPDDGPEGLPASLWENFPAREIVYLALLLHDIAKGREGDHWMMGGEIAAKVLERLGWRQWVEPVQKMVQIHLRMEQIAFRRDIKDPAVIAEFADLVGDERLLGALYLLTVCDLSAVSKRVWTAWKGHLLAELYLETRDWFRRGMKPVVPTVASEVKLVAPLMESRENPKDRVREFVETMQEEYLRVVPPDEVALHVGVVERLQCGEIDHEWLIKEEQGFLVLTLITNDRVGLLAQAAGALVVEGIAIREARIFTRDDGVVIDRFRAEDADVVLRTAAKTRLKNIRRTWLDVTEDGERMAQLFERFKRRRRFLQQPAALVETEIRIEPSESGVLLDIAGPDSVGLLYRLCSVLAEEGLDVRAARVSRRIDGIQDAFLIRGDRQRLSESRYRKALVQKLNEVMTDAE